MKRKHIFFIGLNIRGEWMIFGKNGVKRYADCTRRQAAEDYAAEYERAQKTAKEGVIKDDEQNVQRAFER